MGCLRAGSDDRTPAQLHRIQVSQLSLQHWLFWSSNVVFRKAASWRVCEMPGTGRMGSASVLSTRGSRWSAPRAASLSLGHSQGLNPYSLRLLRVASDEAGDERPCTQLRTPRGIACPISDDRRTHLPTRFDFCRSRSICGGTDGSPQPLISLLTYSV